MENIFTVANAVCELCASEYVASKSKELLDMPDDQRKTTRTHKILRDAQKFATKPCVNFPCKEQIHGIIAYHNLCSDHLYKLIDSIKEYEEDKSERA